MSKKDGGPSEPRTGFNLRPTNREGVYSFAPPPEDFDPLTASPRDLRRHGILPRRPHAAREPKLYEEWARIVGKLWRPSAFDIPVHFEPRPPSSLPRWIPVPLPGGELSHQNSNWAGCVVASSPSGGPWVAAFATWTVPSISIPSALDWSVDPQELRSSSWVGLGGVNLQFNWTILQAGVDHKIDASGQVSYLPWVEWYPVMSNYFGGMTVSAGDELAIAIQLVSTDPGDLPDPAPPPGPYQFGGINFVNVTTGKGQALYIPVPTQADAPPGEAIGEPLNNLTAEWILERMTSWTPKFTPITFNMCMACNTGGAVGAQLSDGTKVELEDNSVSTTQTSVSDTSVVITDIQQ